MPEAVMATKSTDQGWPPPPTKSKCLERVSSRYVRRRMAVALIAGVGIGSIGCCQKSSSQFRPRLGPRGAGPVLTVRRSLPVYLTNRHARCRSAGLKGASGLCLEGCFLQRSGLGWNIPLRAGRRRLVQRDAQWRILVSDQKRALPRVRIGAVPHHLCTMEYVD